MVRTVRKTVSNHFNTHGKSYRSLRHYVYSPLISFISNGKTSCNPSTLKRVLEIGCGGGAFLEILSKDLPQIEFLIGVDISIELLKQLEGKENIRIIQADALSLPFREGIYDLCVTVSLLHHIVDLTPGLSRKKSLTVLQELFRVSKSKGFVMINEEPVMKSYFISFVTFWITRVFNLVSSRTPIVNFLTPYDVQNLIIDAIKSEGGLIIYSDYTKRKRSGRYFLETIYYKIIYFTYEIFFVLNKI